MTVKKLSLQIKHYRKKTMFNEKAEKLNGRAAMVGFVAAVGSYLATGQVIPGLW